MKRLFVALTQVVSIPLLLSACGGGSDENWYPNAAAGIYSGADNNSNPASVLSTPDGQYYAYVASSASSGQMSGVHTAYGRFTGYVFEASFLNSFAAQSTSPRFGQLIGNYFHHQRLSSELFYQGGAAKIEGAFQADSFATDVASKTPSSATGTIQLPGQTAYAARTAEWKLSASTSGFKITAADCQIDGTFSVERQINAMAVSVSGGAPCNLPFAVYRGHLWRDSNRGLTLLIVKPEGDWTRAPIVLVLPG